MPEYRYTAKDEAGKELTGVLQADSVRSAREALISMNLEPLYIQPTAIESNDVQQQQNDVPEETVLKKQWESLESFSLDDANMHEVHDVQTPLPATNKHLQKDEEKDYYPLSETLRLYAGWLLAWYAVVYILGYYQMTRSLEPEIPYVYGLLYSPLVLTLAGIAFMFLFIHSLTKSLNLQGIGKLGIWILGIVAFVLFRINV